MYNKSNLQIFGEGVESTSRDMNFYVFIGTREMGEIDVFKNSHLIIIIIV
mgnify:CR=1 FL=1